MIKRFLKRKDIIFNTSHIFLNKGLNAIVPLLLIPYFNKVFGVGQYGELIYIQSLMTLLMFVSEYGFHVTGTRDISVHKGDKTKLSETVSAIIIVKLILTAICYAGLLVYLYFQEFSGSLQLLYLLTLSAFVLQSFTPYWFFQGISANWIITVVNLFSKVILIMFVFTFITSESLIISVPIAEGFSYAFSFLVSIVIIFFIYKIDFSWPTRKLILFHLRAGRHIFLFSVFNWMITGGAIVAVEIYLSQNELGYYATFSRLMYYAFALVQPINLALFPYISAKAGLPVRDRLHFVREIFKIYAFLVVLFIAALFTLSGPLFDLFFDEKFVQGLEPFMPTFYLMVIWVSLVMVNYFIGLQVLVAFGNDKVYSRFYFVNTILAVTGFVLLTPNLGLIGVPLSLIFGELILFFFLHVAYKNLSADPS